MNLVADTTARDALTGMSEGDFARISDNGSGRVQWDIYTGSSWSTITDTTYADVSSNFLATVTTGNRLRGDGTSGSGLEVVDQGLMTANNTTLTEADSGKHVRWEGGSLILPNLSTITGDRVVYYVWVPGTPTTAELSGVDTIAVVTGDSVDSDTIDQPYQGLSILFGFASGGFDQYYHVISPGTSFTLIGEKSSRKWFTHSIVNPHYLLTSPSYVVNERNMAGGNINSTPSNGHGEIDFVHSSGSGGVYTFECQSDTDLSKVARFSKIIHYYDDNDSGQAFIVWPTAATNIKTDTFGDATVTSSIPGKSGFSGIEIESGETLWIQYNRDFDSSGSRGWRLIMRTGFNTASSGGLGSVSTSARISGDGTGGSPLDIAQNSATTNQVLKWDGSAFSPSDLPVKTAGNMVLAKDSADNLFRAVDQGKMIHLVSGSYSATLTAEDSGSNIIVQYTGGGTPEVTLPQLVGMDTNIGFVAYKVYFFSLESTPNSNQFYDFIPAEFIAQTTDSLEYTTFVGPNISVATSAPTNTLARANGISNGDIWLILGNNSNNTWYFLPVVDNYREQHITAQLTDGATIDWVVKNNTHAYVNIAGDRTIDLQEVPYGECVLLVRQSSGGNTITGWEEDSTTISNLHIIGSSNWGSSANDYNIVVITKWNVGGTDRFTITIGASFT